MNLDSTVSVLTYEEGEDPAIKCYIADPEMQLYLDKYCMPTEVWESFGQPTQISVTVVPVIPPVPVDSRAAFLAMHGTHNGTEYFENSEDAAEAINGRLYCNDCDVWEQAPQSGITQPPEEKEKSDANKA